MALPATEKDNAPMNVFRDKISERIRNDIGDLMPDDMLRQLVEDAVKAEMYRNTNNSAYGEPLTWVRKVVDEAVRARLNEILQETLSNKGDELEELVKKTIAEQAPAMLAKLVLEMATGYSGGVGHVIADHIRSTQNLSSY